MFDGFLAAIKDNLSFLVQTGHTSISFFHYPEKKGVKHLWKISHYGQNSYHLSLGRREEIYIFFIFFLESLVTLIYGINGNIVL